MIYHCYRYSWTYCRLVSWAHFPTLRPLKWWLVTLLRYYRHKHQSRLQEYKWWPLFSSCSIPFLFHVLLAVNVEEMLEKNEIIVDEDIQCVEHCFFFSEFSAITIWLCDEWQTNRMRCSARYFSKANYMKCWANTTAFAVCAI